MKRKIRLTREGLQRLVTESVKNILKENEYYEGSDEDLENNKDMSYSQDLQYRDVMNILNSGYFYKLQNAVDNTTNDMNNVLYMVEKIIDIFNKNIENQGSNKYSDQFEKILIELHEKIPYYEDTIKEMKTFFNSITEKAKSIYPENKKRDAFWHMNDKLEF